MKKVFGKFFVVAILVSLMVAFISCGNDDDDTNGGGTTSYSPKVAGTYKGALSWRKDAATSVITDPNATIKITDLGNNRVRVESGSSNFQFTTKEFGVMEAGGSIISKQSDFSGSLILHPNATPNELSYAFSIAGELLSFNGLKQ